MHGSRNQERRSLSGRSKDHANVARPTQDPIVELPQSQTRFQIAQCSRCRCAIAVAFGVIFGVVLAAGLPALAALGGDANSVAQDRAHMNASLQVSSATAYEVHTVRAPSGTVVNEYLSPAGKVFAVTWHGPFMPDLQQILGTYFQQYSAALAAREKHYGHRPLNLRQSGLVVETGGHMRAYFGRAYVPEMLPQGVSESELK